MKILFFLALIFFSFSALAQSISIDHLAAYVFSYAQTSVGRHRKFTFTPALWGPDKGFASAKSLVESERVQVKSSATGGTKEQSAAKEVEGFTANRKPHLAQTVNLAAGKVPGRRENQGDAEIAGRRGGEDEDQSEPY